MIDLVNQIFYPLDRNQAYKLSKLLMNSELDFVKGLSEISKIYSLNSVINENQMIWKDKNNTPKLILHFNIKSFEIDKILNVYMSTRQYKKIQSFMLIDQTNTSKTAYDIFRLTNQSFMQHCNHFRIKAANPKRVMLNQNKLYFMFSMLKPHEKYRWGSYLLKRKSAIDALEKECKRYNLEQIVEDDYIFWINKLKEIECSFLLVYDPSNIDTFINLYYSLKKKKLKLTYCIVNQIPDGKYEYDIFRLTESSYLEHWNRVRLRKPGYN